MKGVASLGRKLNVFRKSEYARKSSESREQGFEDGKGLRVRRSRSSKLLRLRGGNEEEYEVFLSFHPEDGDRDVKAVQEGKRNVRSLVRFVL